MTRDEPSWHRDAQRAKRQPMLGFLLVTSLACGAGPPGLDGAYLVKTPLGQATLRMETSAEGVVVGSLTGFGGQDFNLLGENQLDDGDWSVVGTLQGAGRADFVFYADEDGAYGLVVTPYDQTGVPQMVSTTVFFATAAASPGPTAPAPVPEFAPAPVREFAPTPEAYAAGGEDAPASAAGPVSGLDPRLVGLWSTQVILNSEVGSVATQLVLEFSANGIARDLGSRSLGGIGGGSIDTGAFDGSGSFRWRTSGNTVHTSFDGIRWMPLARYQFSEGRLFLTYYEDGSTQMWSPH